MGAKHIGLIGMDLTNNHFFARSHRHSLVPWLRTIDEHMRRLGHELARRGVHVYNLSPISRLTAFPRRTLDDFASLAKPARDRLEATPLRFVSYADTPLVGVPAILARTIEARTPHTADCVWRRDGYSERFRYHTGVPWQRSAPEVNALLSRSDLVIVHEGRLHESHRPLLAGKAVIILAHDNWARRDLGLSQAALAVVAQYQAALPKFRHWAMVPNPVPIWEPEFSPGPKSRAVTVCYTPATRADSHPASSPLRWHSKGYSATMRVLDRLASRYQIRLEVLRNRDVAPAEALAMKRRAHIVIDECVTGGYHRNSLEGLTTGCVVVNAMGFDPAVSAVFRRVTGNAPHPFRFATLDGLEGVLSVLIESGVDNLAREGRENRRWMERYWSFDRQWHRFWLPLVTRALRNVGSEERARYWGEHSEGRVVR
jgi:hypothetical protein